LGYLRRKDLAGASRPDVFVANSAYVAARIRRFYGREAHVVHAPVDVDHYLQIERRAGGPSDDGFYLVFGRVVPYKRVDLAVAGGARETVRDGVTGVLFDAQTPEAVAAAIARFEALPLDPAAPRENARGFSRARFRAEMAAVIAQAAEAPRAV